MIQEKHRMMVSIFQCMLPSFPWRIIIKPNEDVCCLYNGFTSMFIQSHENSFFFQTFFKSLNMVSHSCFFFFFEFCSQVNSISNNLFFYDNFLIFCHQVWWIPEEGPPRFSSSAVIFVRRSRRQPLSIKPISRWRLSFARWDWKTRRGVRS